MRTFSKEIIVWMCHNENAVKGNKWRVMGVTGRMHFMKFNLYILQELNTVYSIQMTKWQGATGCPRSHRMPH